MTGISSFTGCHIARAFSDAGHEVSAFLTRRLSDYTQKLERDRLAHSKVTSWIEEAPFGSENFLAALADHTGDVDLLINHGGSIKGYREANFDVLTSVALSIKEARAVMAALKKKNCQRFIHSGSIFEPNEGSGEPGRDLSSPAISIYGVSKNMTWQALSFYAHEQALPLSKIIIANPIGEFENPDRLVPTFVRKWKTGETPELRTAALVRDNIPAPWLAQVYLREAQLRTKPSNAPQAASSQTRVLRPSGIVMNNGEFAQRLAREVKTQQPKLSCELKLTPAPSHEPAVRVNTEPCPELSQSVQVDEFWRSWVTSLL